MSKRVSNKRGKGGARSRPRPGKQRNLAAKATFKPLYGAAIQHKPITFISRIVSATKRMFDQNR